MATLCHALVLTAFEATLTSLDWETVAATDYAVHFLYCPETDAVLFHGDFNDNPQTAISLVKTTLDALNISYNWTAAVIVLNADECEYNADDIKHHLR